MTELKLAQKVDYTLIEETGEAKEALADLGQHSSIAFDTEATGFDPYFADLLLVQLATPNKAYLFDVREVDPLLLKDLLEDKRITKIAQNAAFDYRMLKAKCGIESGPFVDTMLAERILTVGYTRENSLEAIARKYLGIQLDKDVWKTFVNHKKKFTGRQLSYAATDVSILFPIWQAQKQALADEGLEKITALEFRLVPVVAEMELKGFRIDVEKWRTIIAEYGRKRDEVAERIQDEFRPHFRHTQIDLFGNRAAVVNLNSPVQILEAFRKVGLDLPSTGEAVLRRYDHPLAKLLLEYRSYEKIITAFGENLIAKINSKTNRIHPDYMQIGADTGRFACSNPNLQQIPAGSMFRRCFVAAEGYKLIVADYSQVELRIMAELSGDPAIVKAFNEGKDLHTFVASLLYEIPEERVRRDVERRIAKNMNFGMMYGIGARSLAVNIGVSEEKARKLLAKHAQKFSRIKAWLGKVSKEAVKKSYSLTMMGRKRRYQDLNPEDPGYERQRSYVERQGRNTPIQGTSADMTKLAMIYIYERIKKAGFEAAMVHTIHDEIVVEARKDQAGKIAKLVKEEMERAGRKLLKKVPVKADVNVSDTWEH